MNKELEALEKIKDGFGCDMAYYGLNLEYEIVRQALQRLESIDNAKPSEALNITKATEKYTGIDLSVIKQALLKAQEQEKVLKIIFEKYVDLNLLDCDDEVEEYNRHFGKGRQLTEQEFDLLKRWLG